MIVTYLDSGHNIRAVRNVESFIDTFGSGYKCLLYSGKWRTVPNIYRVYSNVEHDQCRHKCRHCKHPFIDVRCSSYFYGRETVNDD